MKQGGYKIQLGKLGEDLAAEFLEKQGCKIIDRNFYTRYGEIDLIARKEDEILFCEVKTRTSKDFGYPEYAVDRKKIDHLLKAVRIYLKINNIKSFWRIDIISIEIEKETNIKWFKDIRIDN